MLVSGARHLRARNLSPRTVDIYLGAARRLDPFLTRQGECGDWDQVDRATLEGYFATLAAERSAGYTSNQYRALQQLWCWLTDEEEVEADPFTRMRPPLVPEQPVPVLRPDQLSALLATCAGKDFTSRRDLALLST